MKKTNHLEVIGILSLSFLLTSNYAVSSCLPEMMKTFEGYDRTKVDFLISCPSMAMMVMIALTPILSRLLKERFTVITALLLMGGCGIVPVFTTSYPLILASRLLMGVGTGLLNAKAVSLIGERFTGSQRSRLQGIRCSMETIGQSSLMLVAGQFLRFGWNYAFMVYATAFAILIMYLTFVPANKQASAKLPNGNETRSHTPYTAKHKMIILSNFLLGMALVSAAVLLSMRVTTYVVETGIGSDVNGATILSVSVFVGFFGGLVFGKWYELLKQMVLPLGLMIITIGMVTIGFAGNLLTVAIGACLCNFGVTLSTSYMFNGLSEHLPIETLHTSNALVLIGCNLGSWTISFVLKVIAMIHPSVSAGFITYAVLFAALAAMFFVKYHIHNRRTA